MTRLEKILWNLGMVAMCLSIPLVGLVLPMACSPEHSGKACRQQCHAAGLEVQRFDPGHACICSERRGP